MGKTEEKPFPANSKGDNATFISQELDEDNKADEATGNDQPCPFFEPGRERSRLNQMTLIDDET